MEFVVTERVLLSMYIFNLLYNAGSSFKGAWSHLFFFIFIVHNVLVMNFKRSTRL